MWYRQTDRQTDLPEPLEGCSRFTIVGDTGQVEALLLMWYRQTDRQTYLNHLKVAAGLPLLETQVRLRLSCSCGTSTRDPLVYPLIITSSGGTAKQNVCKLEEDFLTTLNNVTK